MKTFIIILIVINYIAMGVVFAAVNETEKFDKLNKYGLNIFHILFWPFYIIKYEIKKIISNYKNKKY